MEVVPAGTSKATACDALLARWGMDWAEALAIGDGSNDPDDTCHLRAARLEHEWCEEPRDTLELCFRFTELDLVDEDEAMSRLSGLLVVLCRVWVVGGTLGEAGASITVSVEPVDSLCKARILEDFSSLVSSATVSSGSDGGSFLSFFSSYCVIASCLTNLFLFSVRLFESDNESFFVPPPIDSFICEFSTVPLLSPILQLLFSSILYC